MQIEVGAVYQGKVVSIKNYGAFVALQDGTQGMVHISHVSKGFVKDINTYLKIGDEVQVKVLATGEKIAFSIKDVQNENENTASQASNFEKMMTKFKSQSDEKLSEYNRSKQVKKGNRGR